MQKTRFDPQKHHRRSIRVKRYDYSASDRIRKEYNATGIWQRNYYEHIIRDDKDLQNKTDCIEA